MKGRLKYFNQNKEMYEEHTKYIVGKKAVTKVGYEYNPSLATGGYRGGRSEEGKGSSQNFSQNQAYTMRRRNKTVKELVNNNFVEGKCVFVTLTIDPIKFPFSMRLPHGRDGNGEKQITNVVEVATDEFRKFIRRIKREHSNFIYVAVPELGITDRRIHLHFHMIIDLVGFGGQEASRLWGLGGVNVVDVYDCNGLASYITMENDLYKKNILFGRKGYFASQGLLRNEEIRSWAEEDAEKHKDISYEIGGKQPISTYTTTNEFVGSVLYEYYMRDKDKSDKWNPERKKS